MGVTVMAMFGRFFITYAMNTAAQISLEVVPTELRGQGTAVANVCAQIATFFAPQIVYAVRTDIFLKKMPKSLRIRIFGFSWNYAEGYFARGPLLDLGIYGPVSWRLGRLPSRDRRHEVARHRGRRGGGGRLWRRRECSASRPTRVYLDSIA